MPDLGSLVVVVVQRAISEIVQSRVVHKSDRGAYLAIVNTALNNT